MLEFLVTGAKFFFAALNYFIKGYILKRWPPANRPAVTVRQGTLRGVAAKLPNGSVYHYYKGVPYAKHPIGDLRFKPPVPLEKFDTPVVECLMERSDCIQLDLFTNRAIGSEKGLYLNVYTPEKDANKYPVMVFIHGGGFIAGTGSSLFYNPIHLVQEGVIVVTINYRLGPLGFLSLPSAGISGNAGLKDQRLAFKWIHENIEQFGGDPGNVTIFGESAGSMSAYLHYLSPESRKYFHRVICQSGIPCTETFFQTNGSEKARKLARLLGCKGDSDAEVLETLLKAPASSLVYNQHKVLTNAEKRAGVKFAFMPVIEDALDDDTAGGSIITKTPEEILKSADTLDMPLIDGCNSGEGILSLYLMKNKFQLGNSEPERFVPQLLGPSEDFDRKELGKQIRKFYFGDKLVARSTCDQVSDSMADNYFITNSMINAIWISKYQPRVAHYHYRFTFDGRFSIIKRLFNETKAKGACHGDDVFYMFSPTCLPNLPEESPECRVRETFVKLWTNFARFGNPTPEAVNTGGIGFQWKPVEKNPTSSPSFKWDCLEISQVPRMIRDPYPERLQLWTNLLNKFRKGYL
ncbi:esterase B1-like [Uranotaenia lowii]|uniref:esterase B1-like n=1 Tax=Uranotaenia lowii TaxID=190385 RepID=UPI00247915F6|nr:esterase B1-like [Uranotaenia lowii]